MPSRTPGERLRQARVTRGMSVQELSERTGFSDRSIRAHESGQNGIRAEVAETYAEALAITPAYLLYGTNLPVAPPSEEPRMIPVAGDVQAGVWQEIPDDTTPTEFVPFYDPAYSRARNVYCLRVKGPSMNLVYPEEATVVVVDAVEMGVRELDHVVVRRHQGPLAETTLKEVRMGPKGVIELWPRSSDPNFQTPITIDPRKEHSQEGAEIIAVVVATYSRRPPRSGTLVL